MPNELIIRGTKVGFCPLPQEIGKCASSLRSVNCKIPTNLADVELDYISDRLHVFPVGVMMSKIYTTV